MFKQTIQELIDLIKYKMSPTFENTYFRNVWELNGINDAVISQCYVQFQDSNKSITVKQGRKNEPSLYTLNLKAVFQFPESYDYDKVLDQITHVISQKATIESYILNSETIIKQETKITPTKIMPLILVNFALKKYTLMQHCDLTDKYC